MPSGLANPQGKLTGEALHPSGGFISRYSRVLDRIYTIQSAIVFVVYVAVILVVSFQVFNRFWLQWPVIWTGDLAVILFIWLGFLTASSAVRKSGHFRLSALIDMLGEGRTRRGFEIFSILIIGVISLLLLYQGGRMTLSGLREISPGLGVSMFWAYAALPVSSATALLFAAERLLYEVSGRSDHTAVSEVE